VEDTKISGGDVMERVLSVTNTLIECRVIRDKMEFVSLTITSID
jgi:hypothetical protein